MKIENEMKQWRGEQVNRDEINKSPFMKFAHLINNKM